MSLFRRVRRDKAIAWYLCEREQVLLLGHTPIDDFRKIEGTLLDGWLAQLEDDGFAGSTEDGYEIPWDSIYALRSHPEHKEAMKLLELPEVGHLTPELSSRGSLEDPTFSIAISGWRLNNQPLRGATVTGAVLKETGRRMLLPLEAWRLLKMVREFAACPPEQRSGQYQRLEWGRIRQLAIEAGANLDTFLRKSVALTPEKLTIEIRKIEVGDDTVIEVQPGFDNAPSDWLERFDRQATVRERYDIPTQDGVIQVIITPDVRTVLEEIKSFSNRRVAGARAQAFIVNPYAALGEAANTVIDEDQFEAARNKAGLTYERFLPQFERDGLDYPFKVGLLIESATTWGQTSSETIWFDDVALEKFVKALERALARNFQLLGWEGYDFELQGDATEHLSQLKSALEKRRQPPLLIHYEQLYDISHYAPRISAVDIEPPYYSPFIARKQSDQGWFPENLVSMISWQPEGETEFVSIPVTEKTFSILRKKIDEAKACGASAFKLTSLPKPMPVQEAERIIESFDKAFHHAQSGHWDPAKTESGMARQPRRKALVLRANIGGVDYAEERSEVLSATGRQPVIPASLRPDCALLPHQQEGVAWLQTLFSAGGQYCRGAVLADDMGLGKTLQLLTLMAWAIEQNPEIEPMLVVAPVSLLENWKDEAIKFFKPGVFSIVTAYGDDLASLRVPRESIDPRLRNEDGLTRFLKPDWVGNARVVLTTYETLRDFEFSFAAQRWSIMVCDEAQKIKNPAALLTRAAKKQNVAFKIACTGTPVENTLADLWCLFDFIQPGLLGALNNFGRRYRKPIEARTEEEQARVEELRKLIAPQILRRTKAEVAKDLPQKIVVEHSRKLRLSSRQRDLYIDAINLFNQRNDPEAAAPFKNHLGLLHYLRLICTDPRRHGLDIFKPDPLGKYRQIAPKLDWLLNELESIKAKSDKAIIFCEFRDIQRLLRHYIEESFGIRPAIINGDTSASSSCADSRQARIKDFQKSPGFGVIILSPLAVGFGVNIQAANHVIHYTRTWNPAKEDQATDRAYRIGQSKDVYVYYPVVRADDFMTFDAKLDQLLEEKRKLAGDILNGSGDLKTGDFDLTSVVPPGKILQDEAITMDAVLRMNGEYFEGLTAVLYVRRGFDVHKTAYHGDHGVDVVALSGQDKGLLIQCKASGKEGGKLGWDAIKEVVGGHAFYSRQFPGVEFERVCVTNQFFNEQAWMHARENGVEIIEQPQLEIMLKETAVSMLDVEKILYTAVSRTKCNS
ncbi:MAG TPA: SNF2-related protein [Pseudomonadales bacterium]|nr:SNF2-related protein [Pseudomonadales bacterium]HMY96041.1 SNF2-related protein [Pseudomonadales bacterium]HND26169.1 SNF2-related protein [Pseudomonadales bacterium]HNH70009.1 SNF2-related protein [Pseudomonadales bacterium]HNI73336.1 SNF2-related protein [Accumulibacter sp.]